MTSFVNLVLVLVALVLVARAAWAVWRFARLPRQAKRHYPAVLWHRFRWRWLARNAELAYIDQHHPRLLRPRVPFTTAVQVRPDPHHLMRWPRASFRADEHGWIVTARTVPKVGRAEFDKAAPWLADAWGCCRVSVAQPRPGRVQLRALRRDPLCEPYSQEHMPTGVLPPDPAADLRKLSVYLGRDEWGVHRRLPLSGVAGITVGGQPGFGKTEFIGFLLRQLAPLPAKFIIVDGKGSFDYAPWRDRAWILTGDDLDDAAAAVDTAHTEMRMRLGSILELTGGTPNGWHVGPREGLELLVTIIDEASTFYDQDAFKGDRDAERTSRQIRFLSAQLAKKGRSALCLSVFITQKLDGGALPTSIRDQCQVGMSFAVRTRDAAVCALGEAIKDYPSYCPTTLQDPAYVGVMTARLPVLGADPFVRLRVPKLAPPAVVPVEAPAVAADLDLAPRHFSPST